MAVAARSNRPDPSRVAAVAAAMETVTAMALARHKARVRAKARVVKADGRPSSNASRMARLNRAWAHTKAAVLLCCAKQRLCARAMVSRIRCAPVSTAWAVVVVAGVVAAVVVVVVAVGLVAAGVAGVAVAAALATGVAEHPPLALRWRYCALGLRCL